MPKVTTPAHELTDEERHQIKAARTRQAREQRELERSWTVSPDKSGGQFTPQEIYDAHLRALGYYP